MTGLRLEILGSFALRNGGDALVVPMDAQRLVAFLALHPHPLPRPYVAGRLWPNKTDARALGSLRSALCRGNSQGRGLVETIDNRVVLGKDVAVDFREASALAHRLVTGVQETVDEVEASLLAPELLPGWYDEWLATEREVFRELRVHALERAAAAALAHGRLGAALEATLAAIAADPVRESAHRLLIEVFLAEGNASKALRHYRQIHQELGMQPSDQLRELVRGLMADARADAA